MGTWINFSDLRSKLNFADVLRHYGVEVKAKGSQHHGYCPLPNHNGKKNSPSFSANLIKGIFHCFGCGAKGNLIDFPVLMEKGDPNAGADVRAVALKLQDKFAPATSANRPRHVAPQYELPVETPKPTDCVVVNAPLPFALKNLDPKHPYLERRGFTPETIAHFGLGYCSKGLLAGRIAIPIHDHSGQLVGYCGRLVDDSLISEDNPRYKFPPKREHKGMAHEFQKMKLLYNSHRLKAPVDDLIVVEGIASVWWLNQMGLPNVVALMGWAMSEDQAQIIINLVSPKGRVWLAPNGDESGRRCAMNAFELIAPQKSVRWLKPEEGKQPTDYSGEWWCKQMIK